MPLIVFLYSFLFISCSSPSIEDYQGKGHKLDAQIFFEGKLTAHGIVEDRSGKILKTFVAHMKGTRKDNQIVLDEDFIYGDGSTSKRIWTLEFKDNNVQGTASDVIGKARGVVKDNAFNFKYTLEIPYNDGTIEVSVNDWMYLIDKKTMLARGYMSKFGISVGQISLVMIKH